MEHLSTLTISPHDTIHGIRRVAILLGTMLHEILRVKGDMSTNIVVGTYNRTPGL